MDVFTLPFLVGSPENLRAALDGKLGEAISAKAAPAGFHLLGWWLMGPRNMVNNVHPINVPADVAGLKMRVIPGCPFISRCSACSARIPVVINSAEICTSPCNRRSSTGSKSNLPI